MDSITQIVLGAACGEAVLGKKIGNKALLFGAIGGTIPDLDVYVGNLLYGNAIDAMLFHRGFMHSIFFSVIAALLLGWVVHRLYNTRQRRGNTTRQDWIALFFWSLFTHPILDCFTPYGTQLFAPISHYRVAFNNIAVVDPLYTLPFLICMIAVMFFNRTSPKRKIWLKLGLTMSSLYMLFTVGNKLYIDALFKSSAEDSQIDYIRFSAQPSIFNNILWYGIAETANSYYVADYSLFDTDTKFSTFTKVAKHRDLKPAEFEDVANLAWFSNDYYSVYKLDDETYRYNDLRYPLLDLNDPDSSVFSLILYKEKERLNMKPFKPKFGKLSDALATLWKRIKGI
ncbi:metal-dependent hydrolase [Algibacter mikhailovii]|uniref:Membrane protein n=1 Tax=Algibacter mikhailovii TaxID=425498 RepID=A0A918QVB9_9FLAO|nr:metal-dependent hydrolase [Algibacter mikhailovii]GGZ71389.1 membrane protein [Algibacter mikhailovii]